MLAIWRKRGQLWLVLSLALFAWLLYRTAWVSDDAFISLRVASNFLHGYGLRWNVDERVQTYTHPLWLFALTGAHAATGEPFYSTLYLSWLLSVTTVAVLLFVCPGSTYDKLLALFVLAFSQAFVDFSSSGLENPLTHLLLVAFVAVYVRCKEPKRRALGLAGIAGLAACNRLDTIVLYLPALAYTIVSTWRQAGLHSFLVGAIPVACWEVFSLLYYGFPFPNTAYAKLAQDSTLLTPLAKGVAYLQSSLLYDPLTLFAIAGVLVAATWMPWRPSVWLVLGAPAYLLYVIRIGGDFMAGRFLSAPLLLCTVCWVVAGTARSLATRSLATAATVTVACLGRYPPPLTGADFKLGAGESEVDQFGIHNERRLFFAHSSLLNADKMNPLDRDHPWSSTGARLRMEAARSPQPIVKVVDAIGYAGYFAGPNVHLIDHWALADALMARLPPVSGQYGHFPRVIPDGYVASLQTNSNRLVDPQLREYFRALSTTVRDPLFDVSRLTSAWKLNSGQLAADIDQYAFIRADAVRIALWINNRSQYPCVTSYVWNADRTTAYVLDETSHPGATYPVAWDVSPHGAALVAPEAARNTSRLGELANRGFFTVSVAFHEHCAGPIRDLHELRYTYKRSATGLVVQRQPWPVWVRDFGRGSWHHGRAGVLVGDHVQPR